MKVNEYMQAVENDLVHTYNRFPVTLEREMVYIFMIRMGKNIWISRRESLCLAWDTAIRN